MNKTGRKNLFDNYVASLQEPGEGFEFPSLQEANEALQESISKRTLKSSYEIRNQIEDIEFFLQEKRPHLLNELVTFKMAFIQSSNKETKQSSIKDYFK